jgi:tetratricopeptide (TPR) repeat protein
MMDCAMLLIAARLASCAQPVSHFGQAEAFARSGEYAQALKEYDAMLGTSGEDALIRNNRALIFIATGEPGKAREEAQKAADLAPREGLYRVTLALAWMEGENPDLKKAASVLKKAVRLLKRKKDYDAMAEAYYNLGVVAQRRRKLEDARDYYELALDANPSHEKAGAALDAIAPRQ